MREPSHQKKWYVLSDKWTLIQKLELSKIQFIDHKKLKKEDDQSADASVLLRMENKNTPRSKYGDNV